MLRSTVIFLAALPLRKAVMVDFTTLTILEGTQDEPIEGAAATHFENSFVKCWNAHVFDNFETTATYSSLDVTGSTVTSAFYLGPEFFGAGRRLGGNGGGHGVCDKNDSECNKCDDKGNDSNCQNCRRFLRGDVEEARRRLSTLDDCLETELLSESHSVFQGLSGSTTYICPDDMCATMFSIDEAPIAIVPTATCAGVIITEIMYNPSTQQGSDAHHEWVEIMNYGCDSIDLTGWTIEDASTNVKDSLSALDHGLMFLEPGQYALIIDGTDSAVTADSSIWNIGANVRIFGVDDAAIGNGLTNSGDTLTLKDSTGNEVDRVTFDSGAQCGSQANGQGYSLERVDPLGSGDCSNFRSSELQANNHPKGGTPGTDNFLWNGPSISLGCTCVA